MRAIFVLLVPLLLLACGSPATNTGASVEEDGSFTQVFPYDRDEVFHACIEAAKKLGYTLEVADPMSARISGRSEVTRRGLGAQVQYYLIRTDVESPQAGMTGVRVRVVITFTHHKSGESRTSINDRIVGSREKYDAFFKEIQAQLGE
ncbi:MAG: hypothetical protein ACYTGZ_16405 [Planctomycetota bacterium]|jgi:hypothetical protein